MLPLAGCGTMTETSEAADPSMVCIAFPAISWSDDDSDQTILEVKQFNAARRAWGCD